MKKQINFDNAINSLMKKKLCWDKINFAIKNANKSTALKAVTGDNFSFCLLIFCGTLLLV